MIEALMEEPRFVVDAALAPVSGSTFQPTGFPDLGAAEFERPDGSIAVLVESVQSLTNHFEAIGWDAHARRPIALLEALPYIEVVAGSDEALLTTSREEPHRLAAAYVRDSTIEGEGGTAWIANRLGLTAGRPLDWPHIYREIFALDPLCLVHGVFFSDQKWHGNPKVRRALTAVIEAHDAKPVIWGGVKRDDVSFRQEGAGTAEEGYGFVPYGRKDYTAREIRLTASIDLQQIRGYGLDETATRLLSAIALWELSSLLAGPLRLRTACDLEVISLSVRRPDAATLPTPAELAREIERCSVDFEHRGARRAVRSASVPKSA